MRRIYRLWKISILVFRVFDVTFLQGIAMVLFFLVCLQLLLVFMQIAHPLFSFGTRSGYTMEVNTKQWNEKDLQALEDTHFSVQGVRCNLLVGDCHAAVSTHLRNVCFPEKLGCLLSLHTAFEYHDSIFVSLIGTHFGLLLHVVFHWETFLTSLHLFFFFY